jgi:two-component system, OmpR family, phosphate regulon response regulator OmpR
MHSTNEGKPKILVVDDDLRLRDLLSRYLAEQGFLVTTVANATALDQTLAHERIDVLVLDLMLPGEDGLSICRRLRGTGSDIGIVMLTAKGDDVDRIVGLELGADDYLCKPFNPRELVARLKAVLRRHAPAGPPGAPAVVEQKLAFGACVLDLATRTLTREG